VSILVLISIMLLFLAGYIMGPDKMWYPKPKDLEEWNVGTGDSSP
jgi:hypothetical protein